MRERNRTVNHRCINHFKVRWITVAMPQNWKKCGWWPQDRLQTKNFPKAKEILGRIIPNISDLFYLANMFYIGFPCSSRGWPTALESLLACYPRLSMIFQHFKGKLSQKSWRAAMRKSRRSLRRSQSLTSLWTTCWFAPGSIFLQWWCEIPYILLIVHVSPYEYNFPESPRHAKSLQRLLVRSGLHHGVSKNKRATLLKSYKDFRPSLVHSEPDLTGCFHMVF